MKVSEEWQEWVIDAFGDLVARVGPETVLAAPTLMPTDAFFPDAIEADAVGMRTLVRRMMRHAGLGEVAVDLHVVDEHDGEARSPIVFAGLDGPSALFELHRWTERSTALGFLCFEVARAYRAFHGLDTERTPYRGSIEEDPGIVEQLAAATAVYLGFGVLATNAAHSHKSSGHIDGNWVYTYWEHTFAGGLPAAVDGWALALYTVIRGDRDDAAVIDGHLTANQRAVFRRAQKELRPRRRDLLARLRLPEEADWPEPRAIDASALPREPADDELERRVELRARQREREAEADRPSVVERVRASPESPVARWFWRLMAGMAGYVPVAAVSESILIGLAGAAVAVVAVAFYQSRREAYCCSECQVLLAEAAERCPGCGARVARKGSE